MSDAIFSAVAFGFFGLATVMTIIFLGMMIADDFHNPNKHNKETRK